MYNSPVKLAPLKLTISQNKNKLSSLLKTVSVFEHYYYYHFYSINETGQEPISHTKMDYSNLKKKKQKDKLMKVHKYI